MALRGGTPRRSRHGRADALVLRHVLRADGAPFAARRRRAARHRSRPASGARRRRCGERSDPRDEFHQRGRSDRALHRRDAARARHQSEPHRARRAAGWRARVRRRRDHFTGAARAARNLGGSMKAILVGIALAFASLAQAQIEKPDVHIAVGGKTALYYLPLTITERLGYFKDEGLNVRISDFPGGTRSLEAVVGRSADVAAGAYEHTINMQARRQNFQAFVLTGASPQITVAIVSKLADKYKSPKDLKGLKVGISAPGSSTNMVINYLLAQGGLKPSDVAVIGIGAGATVVAAGGQGRAGGVSANDPALPNVQKARKLNVIPDTRTPEGTAKLFGGPMAAA